MILALVALPLVLTLSLSFYPFDPATGVGDRLTWANYRDVLTDGYYHEIFLRSFWLALLVTVISVLIGVPEAYVLMHLPKRWRAVFMVVVLFLGLKWSLVEYLDFQFSQLSLQAL